MDIRMIVRLLAKRRQLRAQEHWTRQHLESYQAQALHRVRDYAYAHSSFYKRFHQGLYDAPLQDLPVLTKGTLMDHFDDLVTDRAIHLRDAQAYMSAQQADGRFLDRYRVLATSGASGHPGVFIVNGAEWATMLAAGFRFFEWGGIKLMPTHRVKMAVVASTSPYHASAQRGGTFQRLLMPQMQLASSEKIPTIVERLNAWQPELLIGYASMIRILADEQLAGHLHVAPRTVLSSSEVLTQETRRRAVSAWGEVLFNGYSSTEGAVAAECDAHRGMHLMENLAIVEVVDKDNHPVPSGTYGDKILITTLFKFTQPLIRYEMSDSVCLSPNPCPCGRPFRLVEDIQGRVEDILSFVGEAGETVPIRPLVFHRIMDTLPVSGWQVVQEADGLLVLLSGVCGTLDDAMVAGKVHETLAKQGVAISVEVRRVTSIPQGPGGKTPLIKSKR